MGGSEPREVRRVIVDVHSHIMWYPEHVSEQWAQEALASKLVKMKYSGGLTHAASLDLHSYDSKPEDHWAAAQQVDKVVVFGLQGRGSGVWVPNDRSTSTPSSRAIMAAPSAR